MAHRSKTAATVTFSDSSTGKITGVCVAGRDFPVRGKATIATNIDSNADVKGILVVPRIEARWVAELGAMKIRGIISERGGMLSHAAIILRKAGIPAIVSVEGACRKFAAGELLELFFNGESR